MIIHQDVFKDLPVRMIMVLELDRGAKGIKASCVTVQMRKQGPEGLYAVKIVAAGLNKNVGFSIFIQVLLTRLPCHFVEKQES